MGDRAGPAGVAVDVRDRALLGLVDPGQQRVGAGDETGVQELPAGSRIQPGGAQGPAHGGGVVADDEPPAVGPVLKGPEQGPGAQPILSQDDLIVVDPDGGQASRVGGEDLWIGRIRTGCVATHPQGLGGAAGRRGLLPLRTRQPKLDVDNVHRCPQSFEIL